MTHRKLKLGYFVLEGLNSFATTYYFYYFYFFMQQAFGFGNRANLCLAALNGGVYAVMSLWCGKFAERFGYFKALKAGFLIMMVALLVASQMHSATGQTVLIDHGLGLMSSYAHLSRLEVEPGQRVTAGQRIGAIGATGLATGAHLHWGMSWLDIRLDPESALSALRRE